jgi:hypothetical protein
MAFFVPTVVVTNAPQRGHELEQDVRHHWNLTENAIGGRDRRQGNAAQVVFDDTKSEIFSTALPSGARKLVRVKPRLVFLYDLFVTNACDLFATTFGGNAPFYSFVVTVIKAALLVCDRNEGRVYIRSQFFVDEDKFAVEGRFLFADANKILAHLFDSEQQLLFALKDNPPAPDLSTWAYLHTHRGPCQFCQLTLIAFAESRRIKICVTNSVPYPVNWSGALPITSRRVCRMGSAAVLGIEL